VLSSTVDRNVCFMNWSGLLNADRRGIELSGEKSFRREGINSYRFVTKGLRFLTFYRAFVSNFGRAFEKKRSVAFVWFLHGSRVEFDRVFVSFLLCPPISLTALSYQAYRAFVAIFTGSLYRS
jgi:hypothetical protein